MPPNPRFILAACCEVFSLNFYKKREKIKVRREQIIGATQKLILKFGSEHVTIKKIAKEVGISKSAIYQEFRSKSDIFSLLLDNIGESLLGEIEQSLITNGGIVRFLHGVLITHISAVAQGHGISFQIIAEVISLGDKKLNKQLGDIINGYITCVKNLLPVGVKAGEIREDIDLDAAAMLFFGMMESISNYWTLSNYTFNLEEKTEPMWDAFRKAIINVEQ